MHRIWTTEIAAHAGSQVRIAGWMHRFRQLGSVSFLILRDAKGLAQVVVEDRETAATLASVHPETVLSVEGLAVAPVQAPTGCEIKNPVIEIISAASAPPPFEMYRPDLNVQLPTLLDHAAVALRHPRQRALFRIAAASMAGFRSSLSELGFVEIQTPKIVGSATEGGANVFTIDYFGEPAYLAQSPQFYKQTMVGVFERVFEVGPVFRAEPSDTPRHLSEYVSLDAELGFIEDHHTVMAVVETAIRGMLAAIVRDAPEVAENVSIRIPVVPDSIPVIHFAEAQELIYRETDEDCRHEPDLAPAHERHLCEWAYREFRSEFLFVTGYPMVKRPFYTQPDPARPAYSNSFDLLFRGLELVTGGQRLHRYADYLAALEARGLNPSGFETYLEAFKHGMPPHGGFAIGLERWVARLTGVENVRETTLFPRDLHRLAP
jgi:nondiscriminating aspartyl-tRNA synthetase